MYIENKTDVENVGKRYIMKVLKNANQKNAMVDTEMYSKQELQNLEYQGLIFKIDENDVYRVGLVKGDSIEVVYKPTLGFYTTIVRKYLECVEIYVKL